MYSRLLKDTTPVTVPSLSWIDVLFLLSPDLFPTAARKLSLKTAVISHSHLTWADIIF